REDRQIVTHEITEGGTVQRGKRGAETPTHLLKPRQQTRRTRRLVFVQVPREAALLPGLALQREDVGQEAPGWGVGQVLVQIPLEVQRQDLVDLAAAEGAG